MTDVKKESVVLNKDMILTVEDYDIQTIHVKEWGGSIILKSMTGAGRDRYETACIRQGAGQGAGKLDMTDLKALLLSMTIVGEDHKPLFTAKDVTALNTKNAKVINRLCEIAQKMNAIGDDGVEEAEKN